MSETALVPTQLLREIEIALANMGKTVLAGRITNILDFEAGPSAGDPCEHMAVQYPAYWKPLPANWRAVDTYRVNQLFPVNDPSGRIIHARKKLLVPGTRTGGKAMRKDIGEAVASLQGWLDDNADLPAIPETVCLCIRPGESCTSCAGN